ncbi:hypothetical protein Tco_0536965 [Tanacetum coccineum]
MVDLLDNHEKKRSHSGKGMIRKARVIGNALDAVILIISLTNVQSLNETNTKRRSLEVLGAIAKMKPRTKPTMKLVSWLNRQMRQFLTLLIIVIILLLLMMISSSHQLSPLVDDDVGEEEAVENNIKVENNNNIDDESIEVDDVINIKESKNHSLGQSINLEFNSFPNDVPDLTSNGKTAITPSSGGVDKPSNSTNVA